MTIYAWATDKGPSAKAIARGAPHPPEGTGWYHEGDPPWRVFTTTHEDCGGPMWQPPVPYTGTEDTRDWHEYLEEFKRTHPAPERVIRR